MSVVIVGGNECMARRYEDLCAEYSCKAKVFMKTEKGIQDFGSPDLLVLFTSTMSHKMLRSVISETKGHNIKVAHCHTSSMSALKNVLDIHTREKTQCPMS